MPARATLPPARYADLDDFLWRDFENGAQWQRWLRERGGNPTRGSSFAAALALQGALRELEDANNGRPAATEAIERLNTAIVRYALRPVVAPDCSSHLTATGGLVGGMLVVAIEAMADGTWRRFKRCRDDSCRASFYDVSKSGTRAWCSMERCGSRAKMRRFRETTLR